MSAILTSTLLIPATSCVTFTRTVELLFLETSTTMTPKIKYPTRDLSKLSNNLPEDLPSLDLIVTNLHGMYHNIVHWSPVSKGVLNSSSLNSKSTKCLRSCYPRSGIDSFGRWMSSNNWLADLSVDSSVDELVTNFSSQVTGAIDTILINLG